MRKSVTVLMLLVLGFLSSRAQETRVFSNDQRTYQQALKLYNNKQYQASQNLFGSVLATSRDEEVKANSAYYIANAAVRLNQLGADRLMEEFVDQHPTSPRRNSAFTDVADYYFENGRYPYALKWYGKVDRGSLDRKERERFDFRMGYALFNSDKPEAAEPYLQRVSNSAEYGSQAKYYLGYIAYQQDDYQGANERFDQIADQDLLQQRLSYYQADMNFKLGNFQEAIDQAQKQLPKADRREVSELNKIIGESYFNLGEYQKAIPYLEAYRGKKGRWSNTDYYQLGYAYYQQEDYANAIGQFNKIVDGADFVAQNAYYHLAECYLKLDRKQEALNAFRNAARMEFNAGIQKDALLNYARLSYEIGNAYEPVPEVLGSYLQAYPDDTYTAEIRELLVDSYLTSRNFKGALELLEKNRGYASAETFQRVAFYRGVELFLEENYAEALTLFGKSADSGKDPAFKARALFWKAESAYAMDRFEDALTDYIRFQQLPVSRDLEENQTLDYQLGYTYFKLKDYGNASAYFKNYAQSGQTGPRTSDAYMRLGDSYFVNREYSNAISAYNSARAAGSPEKDYADFQEALCLGFLGREGEKRQALSALIGAYPSSTLKDDALFELGNSYVQEGQDGRAIQTYDRLISEYPMSSLVPSSMMRKALVYYNGGRNREALEVFREVASGYPDSDQAAQAVQTAKLIYVDLGEVDAYAQWVRGLDFVEVTDQELETASFEAAEKQRLEGNSSRALKAYSNYLDQFPNGSRHIEARFRAAQLLFENDKPDSALPYFKIVATSGTGEMAEQSLTRVCQILIGQDAYPEAIPFLERLEQVADIPQNRTFAQSNLMRAFFMQEDYQRVLNYAKKVLDNPSLDARIRSDARLMIARAARETGDMETARSRYAELLDTATGETAAEALYYHALFAQQDGDLETSNASVQKLAKEFASYRDWGGRGLILLAQNFDRMDDVFQATYILENVVGNFEDFPEITRTAEAELQRIRAREAEKNSSINPEGN
jgi:TolA-binding protein